MATSTPIVRPDDSSTADEETAAPAAEEVVYDMGPQLSRAAVFNAVMEDAVAEAKTSSKPKGNRCTPNVRALTVSAILFTLITVVHYFAAVIPNSQGVRTFRRLPSESDTGGADCTAGATYFRGDRQWQNTTSRQITVHHPKFCFIHVGKCGGGTMNGLLSSKSGGSHSSKKGPKQKVSTKANYIDIHMTQIQRGSPLATSCLETRLVILWVCDPVQRFISSFGWTAQSNSRNKRLKTWVSDKQLDPTRFSDLEFLVSNVVADGRDVTKFIKAINHGYESLSWYFDEDCSMLDDIPNLFTGRMEYFKTDYENLLLVMNYPATDVKIPSIQSGVMEYQSHKSKKYGVNVSRGTIDFIRGLEQTKLDYRCLQNLVDQCLLSQDYVDQMRQRLSYSM